MLGGNQPQGFTILETMLFLVMSAAIAVGVFTSLNGQINKTQFNEGIHQFAAQLQTIATNVENGYYPTLNNISCKEDNITPNSYPQISNGSNTQGSNYGCTYIGRVIQFNPSGYLTSSPSTLNPQAPNGITNDRVAIVYTVIGRQYVGTTTSTTSLGPNDLVNNLTLSLPIIIGTQSQPTNWSQMLIVPDGLKIKDVSYDNSSGPVGNKQYDNLVGFFSNLGGGGPIGQTSGTTPSSLIPVPSNSYSPPTTPGQEFSGTESSVFCYVSQMRNNSNADGSTVNSVTGIPVSGTTCSQNAANTVVNPQKGVQICLQSTSDSKYYGIITIGGDSITQHANPLNIQVNSYYDSSGNGCPPQ